MRRHHADDLTAPQLDTGAARTGRTSDVLAPRPMLQADVDDLIDRVRKNQALGFVKRPRVLSARRRAMSGAIEFIARTGCSVSYAAALHGVSTNGLRSAIERRSR